MTDTTALDQQAQARAQQAQAEAGQLMPYLQSVAVDSPEREQWAVNAGHQIREQRRRLEAEQKALIDPLNAVIKRIRRLFTPPIQEYKRAEEHLKSGIQGFRARVAETQARALQAARSAEEVRATVEALTPVTAGMHERERWTWQLVDASQVPREYWILDEQRISREVREHKGQTSIPGIRAVSEKTVVLK